MHTDNDYDEWALPQFVILEAKQVKNQVQHVVSHIL